jgi:hypothetical protein
MIILSTGNSESLLPISARSGCIESATQMALGFRSSDEGMDGKQGGYLVTGLCF